MKTPLVLVVAVAENGVIGRNGGLPWRISGDLKHFKTVTMGKPVVMGRKTFESIGKPLPGRTNIVITRDPDYRPGDVLVAASVDAAIEIAEADAKKNNAREIAIIGGSAIFAETLPKAARLELTEVHARPDGDVKFPPFDRNAWRELRREGPIQGPKDDHPWSIVTLERK